MNALYQSNNDYRVCALCGASETSFRRLETHHIFGGSNRKKSDKYNLTVTLCHNCHNEPPYGVHFCAETMQYLHEYGQRKAMQENGWDVQTFREIFGKNYLQEDET